MHPGLSSKFAKPDRLGERSANVFHMCRFWDVCSLRKLSNLNAEGFFRKLLRRITAGGILMMEWAPWAGGKR